MSDLSFAKHDAPTGRMSQDVRFVDMERSVIDDKKSDEEKGLYYFKKKEYFDNDGSEGRRPIDLNFVIKWNRNTPRDVQQWQVRFQAQCIDRELARNVIYPEPLQINADGHYVFGDAVVMIIPGDIWLRHKEVAQKKSKAAVRNKMREYKTKAQREVNKELQGEDAGVEVLDGSHIGGKSLK